MAERERPTEDTPMTDAPERPWSEARQWIVALLSSTTANGTLQITPECEAALDTALALGDREHQAREWLWLNHGHAGPTLYGDDGEMQCHALTCRADFKREPLPQLLGKILKALGDRCQQADEQCNKLRRECGLARTMDEAIAIAKTLRYPIRVQSSFAIGGYGSEAMDALAFQVLAQDALRRSPIHEIRVSPSGDAEQRLAQADAEITALRQQNDALQVRLGQEMMQRRKEADGTVRAELAESELTTLRAALARREGQDEAFRVILTAVRGDEHGQCWDIRKWLDARDIFNDDIGGPNRLVELVCKAVLAGQPREEPVK